jgi:CelD/BcsL family acetyltransferase involved in cellulose biosynthesis
MFELRLIDTMEKWERLSPEWNGLLAESCSNTVFLTWEWLSSWAECYLNADRSLFIVAVYSNDKLAGVAPWYLHRDKYAGFSFRTIRFLGTPEAGSDYLDVFSKTGKEREVAHALYDFLDKKGASLWDSLYLQDMPSHSLFYLYFHNKIEEAGKFSETTPGAFCPIALLPGSSEEYFSRISSNRRQQFNRHRKLFKTDGTVELHTRSNEQAALDDFFAIHRKRYRDNNDMLAVLLNKVSEKTAGRNWVEVDLLSLNGRNAAGLVHLRYNGELSMYLLSVDREFNTKISVGNLLVGLCIDRAITQGTRVYDFLKGDEPYKFHWASGGRRSLNLFFPRKKIGSLLIVMNSFMKSTAKALLR